MNNFKYVIMCGGNYDKFKTPKQLLKVAGEVIVERTIRLLKENGITDIAISTNNPMFDYIDVPKLRDDNNQFEYWGKDETKKSRNSWLRAYYPIDQPVCYIHGDVYFSDKAIKTIVNTQVDDTLFFCSFDKQDGIKHPCSSGGREPFAYKVKNYKKFRKAVDELLEMVDDGKFVGFPPCSWNVYRYLNGLDYGLNAKGYGDLNGIFQYNVGGYMVINDYTNDVDDIKDVKKIEDAIGYIEGGNMKDCKVKVIRKFNDYEGKEINKTNSYKERTIGEEFICSYERFQYLKQNGAVELVEVIPKEEPKQEINVTFEYDKDIEIPKIVEEKQEELESKATLKKSSKKKRK